MNELQLETIKLVPATIKFNKQSIIDELNETLKKYKNLVFTEENTAEIRKVLAELRKGKTAADKFRIANKKEALAPVTEFENDVKAIVKLFDDVINPINDQLKEFEEKRRTEKKKEIENIISEAVEIIELEPKFASQLDVMDEYLAKSFSMNQIKENIEFRANNLLNEQKLELMNKENIESFVKLKNSEHDMNLSVVAYLSQLEFKAIDEVKGTVEQDVQQELNRRSREEAEKKALKEMNEQYEQVPISSAPSSTSVDVSFEPTKDDLPFGDIGEYETLTEYRVETTAENHEKLIRFMEDNGIKYSIEMELPF